MSKPEIIIVGAGAAGSTIAAQLPKDHPVIIVEDVKEMEEQLPFHHENVFVIEKTPEMPMPYIAKDVNKHPFDKFMHGRKRRKHKKTLI